MIKFLTDFRWVHKYEGSRIIWADSISHPPIWLNFNNLKLTANATNPKIVIFVKYWIISTYTFPASENIDFVPFIPRQFVPNKRTNFKPDSNVKYVFKRNRKVVENTQAKTTRLIRLGQLKTTSYAANKNSSEFSSEINKVIFIDLKTGSCLEIFTKMSKYFNSKDPSLYLSLIGLKIKKLLKRSNMKLPIQNIIIFNYRIQTSVLNCFV